MSDDAVQRATGKAWADWFDLLDARGAAQLKHPDIARLVHELGAGDWWSQMVTVAYERARGLREVNQTASGFSASASRTMDVPVARAFEAWTNESARKQWLADADLFLRKATTNKSIRITWRTPGRPDSSVEVMFTPKGKARVQIAVQHSKLADRPTFERMKAYWGDRLDGLKRMLGV